MQQKNGKDGMFSGMKLNIEQLGKEGEEKARHFLKKLGYELTQPDWIGKKEDNFVQFEIKMKSEPFKPPPFEGHGLDIYQLKRRLLLQKQHNLKCMLVIFEKDTSKVYTQWLDKLEKDNYFDTKKGIRIYPLENFEEYIFNIDPNPLS